ncbi:seven-hairpin glycosidase [Setomelanomma holmii]|uniref:alpha-1,2-Mannosidase n=1 Tax=Setomelanomma holmii TaxID=210430 RepID=A0A9P4HLG5_9PLEO|nr:seven-hairpin glycosidase [Setomelanomma holmii]
MRRIKVHRGGRPYQPMSRQHKRALAWLLFGTLTFGAYYIWSARPIDPFAVSFESHQTYMNAEAGSSRLKSLQSYDWRQAPFINKIEPHIPLPSSRPKDLPRIQAESFSETNAQRRRREAQRVAVRDEFQRSWESYREYAWGQDELMPVHGGSKDTFGGWGATLVDSLDTLWIMGFNEYFYEAVEAVAAIDFGKSDLKTISVFETTIRYLGGLLSAYDLSHEPVLLEKAIQLGEMLYRAFDTTNNTPLNFLDIEDAKNTYRSEWPAETNMCFACIGSLTMEFTRLAQITAQPKYFDAVARVTMLLAESQNSTRIPGLWPTNINAAKAQFNQSRFYSLGALADSTYEYFPKMAALLGGLDPVYEQMYTNAAATIDKYMLFRPRVPDEKLGRDLLFCGDVHTPRPGDVRMDPDLQHLTCFIGGMFGLAGRLFENEYHVDLGAKLTKGCVYAYVAMPSGIMPEQLTMMPCPSRINCPWNQTLWQEAKMRICPGLYQAASETDSDTDTEGECNMIPGFPSIRDPRYLLRPEAIESVFILYRITGDRSYLEYAWNMFSAIRHASRTPYANGQIRDVTFDPSRASSRFDGMATREDNIEDKMESFWTAETLKYFYLVFSTSDMISLDEWVFNTEAHPFRRPKARRGGR